MTDDTPSTPDAPEVVATLEDDSGDYFVDILRQPDGQFTYAEYHRTDVEGDGWQQVVNENAQTYTTQFAAYTAATRNVDWLMG